MSTFICLNDDFSKLYEKYARKLYITALVMLKNTADAEDLVQDTALLAMKYFHKLKNRDSFEAWIMKILINRSKKIKFIRIITSTDNLPIDIPSEDANCDLIITLKNALLKLSQKYRLVISLRYLNDLSVKQISGILKLPEGTIKSQLHRGLEKLKHIIELEGGL